MRQSTEYDMSVRRYGDGDAHIVYLHGLGEASGVFKPLLRADALSGAGFTHTTPDLPGYGRSAWPEKPLGLDALARHLTDWLSGFPQPPVLVGHSMGGVLAVLVGQASPSVVKAIVNFEGNVSRDDCVFSGRIADWDEANLTHGYEATARYLQSQAASGDGESFYAAAFRFADPVSTLRHARDLVDVSVAEVMAGRMATLNVPCVFVAGVPRGIAPHSLDLLDRAGVRTVRIEPAGHWVFWDQPDACAEVIAGLA